MVPALGSQRAATKCIGGEEVQLPDLNSGRGTGTPQLNPNSKEVKMLGAAVWMVDGYNQSTALYENVIVKSLFCTLKLIIFAFIYL